MSASLKNKRNFEESSKDEGRKLTYEAVKTIKFFPSNYYLFFEIIFKEIKLSLVFMENGYQFYSLNSLGTIIEKKHFIEFNSNSCAILRVEECHLNIANYVSYVVRIEDKGRNMEKELGNFLKDLPISDISIVDPNIVGFELKIALLDVLHDKSKVFNINNKSPINKEQVCKLLIIYAINKEQVCKLLIIYAINKIMVPYNYMKFSSVLNDLVQKK
ncbi:hypothetical protein M9H77_17026 [Catharanthus roseus]|uniref:Uncharacterized protein n=1 Tax=Catharanthus roseus TaxID=4058 RepID=A0ACC0B3F8_CATRO|nr:hypothetical protein M9H77_17026 [Catharanthus roseus]